MAAGDAPGAVAVALQQASAGDTSVLIRWLTTLDFLRWFDPVFFAYNLLLLVLAMLIPLVITFVYLRLMKGEKYRRLREEIPAPLWQEPQMSALLGSLFSWRQYWPSLALFTLVIVLGASVVLFLKPVIGEAGHTLSGLDFGKGANVLMLGPYAGRRPDESYARLILSLAAFQYGFLGAYTHHIGQLARSYFTLDLTPHTYVDATVRIATGSLVALVLSFHVFGADEVRASTTALPLVSFFIGFFPTRGLLAIEKIATAFLRWADRDRPADEGLSRLPGMSYAHELRLGREGIDTIENLANANALELAVRTGFGWSQLAQWIDQAWLAAHLREGYLDFMRRTAITSRQELLAVAAACDDTTLDTLAGTDTGARIHVRALLALAAAGTTTAAKAEAAAAAAPHPTAQPDLADAARAVAAPRSGPEADD